MTKQEFLAMSLPFGVYAKRAYLGTYKYNSLAYSNEFEVEKDNPSRECCLPILHQLSDLTKEIEHKGEKFVPIEKLREIIGGGWCSVYERAVEIMQEWYIDTLKDKIKYLPFEFIQLFISWHFDIADLITKGEAINVNTLEENPYK